MTAESLTDLKGEEFAMAAKTDIFSQTRTVLAQNAEMAILTKLKANNAMTAITLQTTDANQIVLN